jgi:hypothetical protein
MENKKKENNCSVLTPSLSRESFLFNNSNSNTPRFPSRYGSSNWNPEFGMEIGSPRASPLLGKTSPFSSFGSASNSPPAFTSPRSSIAPGSAVGVFSPSAIGEPYQQQSPQYCGDSLFGVSWGSPMISNCFSPVIPIQAANSSEVALEPSSLVSRTLDMLGLNDSLPDTSADATLPNDQLNRQPSPPHELSDASDKASVAAEVSVLLSGQVNNNNDVTTGGQIPSKSLWVGNIDNSLTEKDLLGIFKAFGPIESIRVLASKECAFVNYENIEDAMKAKSSLQGGHIGNCVVKIAFSRTDAPSSFSAVNQIWSEVPAKTPSPKPGLLDVESVIASGQSARYIVRDSPSDHSILTPLAYLPDELEFHFRDEIPPLKHLGVTMTDGKNHSMDPGHLRDLKRKLEYNHVTSKEVDMIFDQMIGEIVELATDGFGNTVVQKLIERCSDQQRLKIIEICASQLSSIGIHKNGTWVVQKMMEHAKTSNQMQMLLFNLRPSTPSLLKDPFGNYVIQACLKLGAHRDQFVFDTMYLKCLEVGRGKFGARAMRACLESQYATKKQQKLVAVAVIRHALILVTDPNGILLIHWLVDNSELAGRFTVLVEKLLPRVAYLSNQKLSHVVILKILSQMVEMDAKQKMIVNGIFKDDDSIAATIFGGESPFERRASVMPEPCEYGTSIVLRCLQLEQDPQVKSEMSARVESVMERALHGPANYRNLQGRGQFYKRLIEELQQPTVTKSLESLPKSPFINTKLNQQPKPETKAAFFNQDSVIRRQTFE